MAAGACGCSVVWAATALCYSLQQRWKPCLHCAACLLLTDAGSTTEGSWGAKTMCCCCCCCRRRCKRWQLWARTRTLYSTTQHGPSRICRCGART
jgi:hypothetical protein